jgi:hypothetical protein
MERPNQSLVFVFIIAIVVIIQACGLSSPAALGSFEMVDASDRLGNRGDVVMGFLWKIGRFLSREFCQLSVRPDQALHIRSHLEARGVS